MLDIMPNDTMNSILTSLCQHAYNENENGLGLDAHANINANICD